MTLKSLDAIAWVKQRDALGLSYDDRTRTFEATAAGNANGTTIITSTLASYGGGNAAFPGRWVEVVNCTNGPTGEGGQRLRRMIKQWVSSTFTATIDALPFQVSAGDRFVLLDPPHGYFCQSSGVSQVNIKDQDRTETDDYWVGSAQQGGHYVEVLRSALVAETTVRRVLNFSAGTDTLSCVSLGANTAVGELFEVWQYPEISNGNLGEPEYPRLDRSAITGAAGIVRGVAGLKAGTADLELLFRGPGRGREGDAAELDTALGAVLDATAASADVTVSDGATTALVPPLAGAPVEGALYCAETGDAFLCYDVAAGTSKITPNPTLRYAPTKNVTLYGLRKYGPSDALNYALSLKGWHGKEEVNYLWGCAPTITFSGTRGDYLKSAIKLVAADGATAYQTHAAANYARAWRPQRPTVIPKMLGDARVVLDGTEFECRSWSLDLGLELQPHVNLSAPNGTDGFQLTKDNPTFQLELWFDADSKALRQKFMEGKPMRFFLQAGEYPGDPGVFVFWAYEVEITSVVDGDENGLRTVTVQGRVTYDATQTDFERYYLAIG